MLDLYKNIRKRREELGLSQEALARMVGYTDRSSIAKIEAGKVDLSQTKIMEIAKALKVSAGQLMGYDGIEQPPSAYDVLEASLYNVAAGDGAYNDTYPSEFISSNNDLDDSEYSFCKVQGDSMYPVLLDGDIVKVRHQTETIPQDYTVVKVDGDHCTVKHIEIVEKGVWLRADNKSIYKDRFYTTQEVMTLPISIIGKVVEMRRNFT